MNATPAPPFAISVTVRPEDIDELGHVNNGVYLRWIQEAAVAHWKTIAPAPAQAQLVWVVRRHEIDYRHPVFLETSVLARTWVGQAQGLSFERHTEIVDPADDRLLARARTLWIPLDASTRRPCRVPPEVRALFSTAT